jgi:Trk-type K+ transport system membrane component
MNKLDKQFGEIMKGVRIESPSSDFTLKVMSRVYAEAAVKPKPILNDYQPVISKRTWIILIAAFILLIVYVVAAGQSTPENGRGFWTAFFGKLSLASNEGNTVLNAGMGIFKSIPLTAYLIVITSLALWTLDSVFQYFRQHTY